MDTKLLSKLFINGCEIPSPSGEEGLVAKWVEKNLKLLNWETWIDGQGNVYAYFEKNKNLETLVFCAHMDTVQKAGEKIKVIFDGQTFKSDGATVLGADNKAGVVSLLVAAKEIKREQLKSNLLFLFPVREEAGLMGSSYFNFSKSKVKYVFNIDSGDDPGVFVYRSLGFQNFEIRIIGKSAHAAKNYNLGKDAIKAAGELIAILPVGKDEKNGWTMNIGKITGGNSTNVVCDNVTLHGELRAFKIETMDLLKKEISLTCNKIAKQTGCKIYFEVDKESYIAPFLGKKDSEISQVSAKAAICVGLKPVFKEAYSTSDANSFCAKGLSVISVSRGGVGGHSKTESIALSDLTKAVALVLQLSKL